MKITLDVSNVVLTVGDGMDLVSIYTPPVEDVSPFWDWGFVLNTYVAKGAGENYIKDVLKVDDFVEINLNEH